MLSTPLLTKIRIMVDVYQTVSNQNELYGPGKPSHVKVNFNTDSKGAIVMIRTFLSQGSQSITDAHLLWSTAGMKE